MNTPTEYRIYDKLINKWVSTPMLINSHTGEVAHQRPQDFEIMQFCGVLDTSKWDELPEQEQREHIKYKDTWIGRFIFDGDIVEATTKYTKRTTIECVQLYICGDIRLARPFSYRFPIENKTYSDFYSSFKVIGNKFDNPDLWENIMNKGKE